VFPEIDFDKVEHVHGMNITFVTTAKSNEEAKEMLGMLGMPFRG
jgi:large subunit ribosomal protein L5